MALLTSRQPPRTSFKFLLVSMMNSTVMSILVLMIVALDLVFFFLQSSSTARDKVGGAGFIAEGAIVVGFFLTESVIKVFGYGPGNYYRLPWNVIDSLVVAVTTSGYFVWLFTSDFGNATYETGVDTGIRVSAIFRNFCVLRVYHAARALTNIQTTAVVSDRITVPVRKCISVLSRLQQALSLRLISNLVGQKVSADEVGWVSHAISTGALAKGFVADGIEKDMQRFLVETWGMLPREPVSHQRQGLRIRSAPDLKPINTYLQLDPAGLSALSAHLSSAHLWTFDIFRLREITPYPLITITFHALHRLGLVRSLSIPENILVEFLWRVEQGHREANLYHNSTHVADVVQAMFFFIHEMKISRKLTPIEGLACIIGSAIHDLEHLGRSNVFLVNIHHEVAERYHNRSVLENESLVRAFELLLDPRYNFLAHLPRNEVDYFRHCVVEMVLATDNSRHFDLTGKLKALQINQLLDLDSVLDKTLYLQVLLHVADISNPARPAELSNEWSRRVQEEFWAQGDDERARGLFVVKFFDRNAGGVAVPLLQLSFIENFVQPLFLLFVSITEEYIGVTSAGRELAPRLAGNKRYWADQLLKVAEDAKQSSQ